MLENAFKKYRENLKPSNEDKYKTWGKIEGKLYKEKLSGNISLFRINWRIALIILFIIIILPIGYTSYSIIYKYATDQSKEVVNEQLEEPTIEADVMEKSYDTEDYDGDIEQLEKKTSKDLIFYMFIIGGALIGLGIIGVIISLRKKKINNSENLK